MSEFKNEILRMIADGDVSFPASDDDLAEFACHALRTHWAMEKRKAIRKALPSKLDATARVESIILSRAEKTIFIGALVQAITKASWAREAGIDQKYVISQVNRLVSEGKICQSGQSLSMPFPEISEDEKNAEIELMVRTALMKRQGKRVYLSEFVHGYCNTARAQRLGIGIAVVHKVVSAMTSEGLISKRGGYFFVNW